MELLFQIVASFVIDAKANLINISFVDELSFVIVEPRFFNVSISSNLYPFSMMLGAGI